MNWIDSDRRTRYISVGACIDSSICLIFPAALGSVDAALGVLENDRCCCSFASHTGGDSTRYKMHHIHRTVSCPVCSTS